MNEADALEVALAAAANTITSFTVYISVAFGYLVAAYLVGKSLTRSQVTIVNTLFVVSTLSTILSVITQLNYMELARAEAGPFAPQGVLDTAAFWRFYMSSLMLLGILASLSFMIGVRRPTED